MQHSGAAAKCRFAHGSKRVDTAADTVTALHPYQRCNLGGVGRGGGDDISSRKADFERVGIAVVPVSGSETVSVSGVRVEGAGRTAAAAATHG